MTDHGLEDTTQRKKSKVVEVAERFTFIGLASNLIMYLTDELHEPTSTAAKNVNTWVGVSCVFPIVGAFIADSYLGRFKTIVGMVFLILSVSVIPWHYRKALFFFALYILAVGEGGHKPCVQTFAADQFDQNLPEEKKAKSSFFNWWFFGIMVGATSAIIVVVYME
ncbi:protein nrt1/ ptr family 5.4, partial [Quercus suber]